MDFCMHLLLTLVPVPRNFPSVVFGRLQSVCIGQLCTCGGCEYLSTKPWLLESLGCQ